MHNKEEQIDCSNEHDEATINGESARKKAGSAARRYLGLEP